MSRPTGRVLRRRQNPSEENDDDIISTASHVIDEDLPMNPRKKRKATGSPLFKGTREIDGWDHAGVKNSDFESIDKMDDKDTNQNIYHNEKGKKSQVAQAHKERMSRIVADHSILTNELFQLSEYKSLVYWDPLKNSEDKSELYQTFQKEHQLDWHDEPELNNELPIRLQKKLQANLKKNPYKEEILSMAKAKEEEILHQFSSLATPATLSDFKLTESNSKQNSKYRPESISKTKGKINFEIKMDAQKEEKVNSKEKEIPSAKEKKIDSYDTMTSSSDDDSDIEQRRVPTITHIKKIKLNITIPPPFITHPSHKARPEFNSVDKFLNSYKSLDEDVTIEEYDKYVTEQTAVFSKLAKGIENHILRLNDNGDRIEKLPLPPKYADPLKTIPTHYDHLVAQGMNMSKLISDSRRAHQVKAKKIASIVEQHFRRKAGEGDRLKREQEKKLRGIARLAMQSVKKRWNQAEKVFRLLQKQRDEEVKMIKGKEHLTQMLEHSTQLLEAQLNQRDDDLIEREKSSSSDASDVNLSSSSGSDSELEDENGLQEEKQHLSDAKLTVEELKEKYADLKNFQISGGDNKEEDSNVSDVESEGSMEPNVNGDESSLALLYEPKKSPSIEPSLEELSKLTELTAEEKQVLASQPLGDPILDTDSELSDSDDDSSLSESESEVDSDEEREDGVDTRNGQKSSLASLFGAHIDESDDESVHSAKSDSDKDSTPVSTPEDDKETKDTNGVVDVPLPSLLRGNLRPYQKQGLNWLASLYNNNTNGILADEMGLGKTIQTISLVSYLACEKHIWGPHLIVVPTSVMLNWEMEFKRFAPGFKVMTYYGSPQQRKEKRKGWNNPDAFHVCITSYQLVVQDHQAFRRKRWRYMILDEAHNIKNFRSNRWKALLNFNTEHRLLLTGTPLQNNIMELWSLLYFLMPSTKINQAMPQGFANLNDFQQWFGKPVDKILELGGSEADMETKKTVSKLHQVLRPYLLRRLKADVEKQMPAKHEHIVYCRLSKRQRYLYDDFMSRAQTRETLASGNFLSIINCLMQLRKVCNHPDLFEVRPIVTSFAMTKSVVSDYNMKELSVRKLLYSEDKVDLSVLNLLPITHEHLNTFTSKTIQKYRADKQLFLECKRLDDVLSDVVEPNFKDINGYYKYLKYQEQIDARDHIRQVLYLNSLRCQMQPLYGENLVKKLTIFTDKIFSGESNSLLTNLVMSVEERSEYMKDSIEKFSCITPAAVCLDMKELVLPANMKNELRKETKLELTKPFHQSQVKLSIAFPDKSLLQYDCGKLQRLATLLQDLKDGGHRALIFTQMTKVLDILEQFLNIHGYRYMRLDGSTKIEDRQILTERFNTDPRITCFILSTRSGGLGINLTGADTVIFYDSDWNPAMDKQCQDRCHRIGQTRDVHIFRFVSEATIESNILRKANQKRQLDNVVIQEGDFTTDYFGKFSVKELLGDSAKDLNINVNKPLLGDNSAGIGKVLAQAEDDDDAAAANIAMKEVELDDEDFDENKAQSQLGSLSNTPSQTPAPTHLDAESATPVENIAISDPINEDREDIDYEDGVGHIDEYMIRFIAEGNLWD